MDMEAEVRHLQDSVQEESFILANPVMEQRFSELCDEVLREFSESPIEKQFQHYMEVAFNSLSSDLSAEDRDWQALSSGGVSKEQIRKHFRLLSRKYAKYDGNCKQIIRLYVDFAVGPGFTWSSPDGEKEKLLRQFYRRRSNRRFFGLLGQRANARHLLVDGELFLPIFGRSTDSTIRRFDPEEIVDFMVNPEDQMDVWGYMRKITDTKNVGGQRRDEILYYRDWYSEQNNIGVGVRKSTGEPPTSDEGPPVWQEGVRVAFIPLDEDEDGRGLSNLMTGLLWSKAHRHFMRVRISIQQAVSMFVRKIKSKGGISSLNKLINNFTVPATTADDPHRQQIPPASTWFENQGATLENLRMDTGAEGARVDSGSLIQAIGVGSGIFPHWLGSGESFRLATAGAMEPPMVRTFESFQNILLHLYRELFEYVLEEGDPDLIMNEGGLNVDFDVPQIQTRDIPRYIHAINETMTSIPSAKRLPDLISHLMTQFNFSDPSQVADRLLRLVEEDREKMDERLAGQGDSDSEDNDPADDQDGNNGSEQGASGGANGGASGQNTQATAHPPKNVLATLLNMPKGRG